MHAQPLQTSPAFPIRDAVRHELNWADSQNLPQVRNRKARSA